jgi:hypothetical protein
MRFIDQYVSNNEGFQLDIVGEIAFHRCNTNLQGRQLIQVLH